MPYTISRNTKGEYCVYKRDADGQPMGESLGCHATRNAAGAQIGAIERSEETKMDKPQAQKKLQPLTQAEVGYVTVSPNMGSGEACAACRWYYTLPEGSFCHLVETNPEYIEPTGWCKRFEGAPPSAIPDLTIVVEDGSLSVEVEPPSMDMGDEDKQKGNNRTGEKPATNTPGGILGAIKSFFGVGSTEPPFNVFKTLGHRYWFAAYTNNFLDLEGEIISDKAHERYVARAQMGIVPMPELWLKHIVGTKHGETLWLWKDGHMVCAVGKFDDTPLGRAMEKTYRAARQKDIELSHGFEYPRWAKKDGIYADYTTFEISTIPTQYGRGANPFIEFEEISAMALSEHDRKMLEQYLPADEFQRVVKLNEQHGERMKQLEAIGIAYKDYADVTPNPPIPQPHADAQKVLLGGVLEGQEETLSAVEKLTRVFDGAMKALEAQKTELAQAKAGYESAAKTLQALINARPVRVDETNGNAVTDTDADKALEAAAGVEYDPHYPGMKVPLKQS